MAKSGHQVSPLANSPPAGKGMGTPERAGFVLMERPFLGYLNLRGALHSAGLRDKIEDVLALSLPLKPNTVTLDGPRLACWLGPDEWLVITGPGEEQRVLEGIRAVISGQRAAVSDVSGGQTLIESAGRHARDVLAKGCTLDLHPRVFPPGRCAQTLVARCPAMILRVDSRDTLGVVVGRSFADYLWRWLVDAAQEYDLAVLPPAEPVQLGLEPFQNVQSPCPQNGGERKERGESPTL
jgi:sarcosine oxidase, subunit gamma